MNFAKAFENNCFVKYFSPATSFCSGVFVTCVDGAL